MCLRLSACLLLLVGTRCTRSESHQAPDLFYLYKTIEVGKNPTSVVTGDLNGDHIADLITTNIGSDSLSVLIGIGDGNFRDPVTIRMPEQPRAVVLHDFNEDGKLDMAVATAGNNRVTILLGDGTGQFTRGDSYPAVRSPVSLAVGDFNHDRKADLAVALRNDKLLVLLGRGDGSFLQKAVYEYGDTPTSVVAADVNEDGLPDLVVTHGGKMSSSVVVFLGNGDGTFRSPVAYKTGHSPLNVSVLDLNGDRHLDLLVVNGERDDIAVANNLSSDLSVLLGKGDGTFWQPPRSYRTGAAPFAVTAVSFAPQDPRPGLVTANNLANTISVFLAKDPRSNIVPRN